MAAWGNLIRDAREAAGLSREQLADMLGVNVSTVTKMENGGIKTMPPAMFKKIASALRSLSPADLLTAMGYEVVVPSEGRFPELTRVVAALSPLHREQLLEHARALALLEQGMAERGKR